MYTNVNSRINRYLGKVNENIKLEILQDEDIWNLLWKKISDQDEKNLSIDEVLEKYCLGDRMYKKQTIFDFFIIDGIIGISVGEVASLAGGGHTLLYTYDGTDLNKLDTVGVWMG